MKKLRRFLKYFVLAVVLLVLVLGLGVTGWVSYLMHTRLPNLDRKVSHPSLTAEVSLIRDDWGVPHIEAKTETDAYFALGYAMAQDRLFQMELFRRLARGELAELLGPLAAPVDQIARSFRLRTNAERYCNQTQDRCPEVRKATEAFVAGINHCMETEPLPFEFSVLQIPVRPFTVVDCLTAAGILPVSFSDGMRLDPLVTMMKEKYPDLDIDALTPGYHKQIPTTVMESLEEAAAYLEAKAEERPAEENREEGGGSGAAPSMQRFEVVLAQFQSLSDLLGPALGSNSWVLAPSRSKSGQAILANDPHVGFTNPSTWYEAHLRFGGFENYGYYLPLIPFALLGHNRERGWGLTMFENDDVDFYRETFHPDDPKKVMYKGEWVDVQEERETIRVRFGRDQQYTVRLTPHGPVITDLYRLLMGYEGPDLAMAWVWQQVEYTDMIAFYRMGHACDIDRFQEAVSLITSPGLNVLYADRHGNIAWWAAGKISIRPDHVNYKELLDGASGKDEILGFLPFEQNPQLRNPAWGYIASANNKSTVKPVGAIEDLQGYWQPDDRAARIEQMIEERAKWDIEELKAAQFDDQAYAAPAITKAVFAILRDASRELEPLEQYVLQRWHIWDYRHGVGSVGASVYQVFCQRLLRNTLHDEMGEKLLRCYGTVADHWNFFKYAIEEEDLPFWDDRSTPEKETLRDMVVKSYKETVAFLRDELGGEVGEWTWGRIHTIEFKHPFGYLPLLGRFFNIGPFPASGAAQVVNNMLYIHSGARFDVIAGPSTRRLIDFADPEHSLTILPTGNSGHVMSPHYDDQAEMFMAGQYREPRFTKGQIKKHTKHVMRFTPGPL